MTLSNSKKFLLFFAIIAIITVIVYLPSLNHIPRSDHLPYLANIAEESDLTSLTLKHYAFNREEMAFGMKDPLLFRPLTYIFSGAEKYFFGYNLLYWQATGILLHIMVLWCLLRILWRITPGKMAAVFCLFFSVLLANAEFVTWHHVHGYFICIIAVLLALDQILRLHRTKILTRGILSKLFITFLAACFSHEIGFIFCFLFALYFFFSFDNIKKQSSLKLIYKNTNKYLVAFAVALPCFIYLGASMADLFFRGQLATISTTTFSLSNFFYSLRTAFVALFWWAYIGLFPTLTFTEFAQRTFMYPLFIPIEGYTFQPSAPLLLPAFVCLGLIVFYIAHAKKYMTKRFSKESWRIWLLLSSMLYSFAFLVCYGRASVKGFQRIMVDNGSYNYFFWIFFIILIYSVLPVYQIKKLRKRFLRMFLVFGLTVLIAVNAFLTFQLNSQRAAQSQHQAVLIKQIEELIKVSSSESDFSFAVHPENQHNLISYLKGADPSGQHFNLVELLYPQYYKADHPKYLLIYTDQTGWLWRRSDFFLDDRHH